MIIRKPDETIGKREKPYLRRWFLRRDPAQGNRYLHHIKRSDEDRAKHDHPWDNGSFIIGPLGYKEHIVDGTVKFRLPFQWISRKAEDAHRIELYMLFGKEIPCWTLFFTGPKRREWGFHCPQGWRHWRDFIGLPEGEPRGDEVGRGCE